MEPMNYACLLCRLRNRIMVLSPQKFPTRLYALYLVVSSPHPLNALLPYLIPSRPALCNLRPQQHTKRVKPYPNRRHLLHRPHVLHACVARHAGCGGRRGERHCGASDYVPGTGRLEEREQRVRDVGGGEVGGEGGVGLWEGG